MQASMGNSTGIKFPPTSSLRRFQAAREGQSGSEGRRRRNDLAAKSERGQSCRAAARLKNVLRSISLELLPHAAPRFSTYQRLATHCTLACSVFILTEESYTHVVANVQCLRNGVLANWPAQTRFEKPTSEKVTYQDLASIAVVFSRAARCPVVRLCPLLFAAFTLAVSTSAQSQLPSPGTSGQISGHIYRADTGAPVDGATIFLRSADNPVETRVPPVRSDKDGSYIFSDVAAGNYVLMAYRSGFLGPAVYGSESPTIDLSYGFAFFCGANISCVSVAQGQIVDGIDVRLSAGPDVATLPIEPIAAGTFPDHKVSFDQLRISPDGQIVAVVTNDSITSPNCPCEVWLYG